MIIMSGRAYLRASATEQNATRARPRLDRFAAEHGLSIASRSIENESEARLARPELFRLLGAPKGISASKLSLVPSGDRVGFEAFIPVRTLADCCHGDVLLAEQVDRLSRLTAPDGQRTVRPHFGFDAAGGRKRPVLQMVRTSAPSCVATLDRAGARSLPPRMAGSPVPTHETGEREPPLL